MARRERLAPLESVYHHGTPTTDSVYHNGTPTPDSTVNRAEPVCPFKGPNKLDLVGCTRVREALATTHPVHHRSATRFGARASSATGPAP